MSTAKGNTAGKEQRRARRRRRKMAAATGTMLLVAAAVAGEPVTGGSMPLAGGVGGGLYGMTDPDSVSANGEVGEEDRIGDEVLKSAGNIDRLRQLGPAGDLPNGPLMIPADLYKAYTNAALMLATELPSCKIHWSLLASIGRIESNHARGGQVDAAGNTVPHILGPVLNGGGFAAIRDTDGGRLDDDARWDRAVGAMQFIPSTWRGYAADGNNDGISSPHNIYDATVAAGKYLCSGGLDLSNPQDKATAVFRYNHSDSYVRTVLIWADAYAKGTHPLPSDLGPSPAELAAMNPPVALPGGTKPAKPKPGTHTTTRTTIVTPPGSSSPTTTPPSCGPSTTPTTSTTTTTPPSSPPSTTTTPGCPPSSSTPPPSSSASEGSTSVTPTSAAPSSSAPAGEAGSSVAATS